MKASTAGEVSRQPEVNQRTCTRKTLDKQTDRKEKRKESEGRFELFPPLERVNEKGTCCNGDGNGNEFGVTRGVRMKRYRRERTLLAFLSH